MDPVTVSEIESQKDLFFKKVFELYFERVTGYIFSYYRDRETAKNIAQDTFVSFWENIDKVDSSKSPLPYLFFIAKNKTLNALKRDIVKGKYSSYTQKRELEIRYKVMESCTMDLVQGKEMERIIATSIEQMKENVRETFCLSRFRNLKNEEIAQMLDVSVKTVEYRISIALRILRKDLKDFIHIIVLFVAFLFD